MIDRLTNKDQHGPVLEEVQVKIEGEGAPTAKRALANNGCHKDTDSDTDNDPPGSIREVGETKIAVAPKRLKRDRKSKTKLCTTGALLVIDCDNQHGEDAMERILNHMRR